MVFEIIKRFKNFIYWLYLQYLFNTSCFILNAREVYLFNCLILTIMIIVGYSTYVFLPPQLYKVLNLLMMLCGLSNETRYYDPVGQSVN